MTLISFRIYKGNELSHACILCKNPEGRIGWWDAVDNTFYEQTERVLVMRENSIKEGQYIDTGISPFKEGGK